MESSTEDPEYLDFIRDQPCAVGFPACQGRTEAHHATHGRGMGQKTPDRTAVPLCMRCHRAFHDGGRPFAEMGKEGRRLWMDRMAAKYQLLYSQLRVGADLIAY